MVMTPVLLIMISTSCRNFSLLQGKKKKKERITEKEGKKKCESIFLKEKIIKGCRPSQPWFTIETT